MAEEQNQEACKVAFEKKDEHITLTAKVTPDKTKLFIDCKKLNFEDTHIVTTQEILALLPGVSQPLLHQEILERITTEVNDNQEVTHRRIARGKEPIEGRDGKLLLLVKPYHRQTKAEAVEFIDPRFMRTFDNIEKGTPVARLYPPSEGVEGQDVFGNVIKAKAGKAVKATPAETLIVKPGDATNRFDTFVSNVAGYLTEESGKLTIKEELIIAGDVNYRTGDIDFIGSVTVKGSLMKDFTIKSRKDVALDGGSVSGRIHAYEGSIKIKGTASGETLRQINAPEAAESRVLQAVAKKERADFRCSGTFEAHALQGVSVEAIGDILVEKEISSCLLRTRGIVSVPRGHLFGGDTFVVCGLEAKIIGTKSGSDTVIHLASDIESSVEYANIMHEVEAATAAENLLKLHLGPYAQNPSRLTLLQEPHRKKMMALAEKLKLIRSSLAALEVKRQELLSGAHSNPVLRINFTEKLYRGVILRAGDVTFEPDADLTGPGTVEYLSAPKSFIVSELKPLVCTVQRTSTGMGGQ